MSRKKIFVIVGLVIVLPIAYYLLSPFWRNIVRNDPDPLAHLRPDQREEFENQMKQTEGLVVKMDDAMPNQPTVIAEGKFVDAAHDVKGKAKLIQENGHTILRFEDFKTVNGPGLHIWLAADLEGKDYIELGPILATEGNVNYDVEQAVDLTKYNKVLVWCVPFGVLFSYAELTTVSP